MLQEPALTLYKRRLLKFLDQRNGIEVRTTQLHTDMQVNHDINTRREDVEQALGVLKDEGYATLRHTDFNGVVWKVTPSGHEAAAKIELEN